MVRNDYILKKLADLSRVRKEIDRIRDVILVNLLNEKDEINSARRSLGTLFIYVHFLIHRYTCISSTLYYVLNRKD